MDLSKYVELFLSEGREHVAELNAALLELERAPASADALGGAFRAVHSIKGMAGAMGYTAVNDIAHALESTLDAVRRGEEQVSRSLLAHLVDEADSLAREVESAVIPPDQRAESGSGSSGSAHPMSPTVKRSGDRATHVRVRASRLDALMNLVGELEIARGRLERELGRAASAPVADAFAHTSRLLTELRDQVISARMVPVGQVFERFPRLVRETARALGKEIEFTLDGADIELDRSMLDRIGDPVMHLLRNALDHGIELSGMRTAAGKDERGHLTLSAQRESGYVLIRVADDGRGIDRKRVLERAIEAGIVEKQTAMLSDVDLLRVLAHPGFSTAAAVSNVSGRGVGLDVVDAAVRMLGGTIEIRTIEGRGTAITLRLPLSIAIVRALITRVGEETFAIPFTHVHETLEVEPPVSALRTGDWTSMTVAGEPSEVVLLRRSFGLPVRVAEQMKAVSVSARGRRGLLIVDEFVGQQDIVVKRFDPPRGGTSMFSGATVLGDGSPTLILDVNSLL